MQAEITVKKEKTTGRLHLKNLINVICLEKNKIVFFWLF